MQFEDLERQLRFPSHLEPLRTRVRRYVRIGVAILIVVLLLVGGRTSVYTIEAEEVGVVQRFGRYSDTTPPGLHFMIPFGIDRVTPVKVGRTLKMEFGFQTQVPGVRTVYSRRDFSEVSLMLTGDLNIAEVEWVIQYRIQDARDYLFNVRHVEETLQDVSESAMRTVVGDRSVSETLTTGRREIGQEAKERIQALMDELHSGVLITVVQLQDVNPPPPVQPAFNGVNEARQEKERTINEAKQEYNRAIPEAEGQARQVLEEAQGYATERVNEAKGDTARFQSVLEEYRKAPSVTRRRLYLETLQEVLPRVGRKIVVDPDAQGVLKLLDLTGEAGR